MARLGVQLRLKRSEALQKSLKPTCTCLLGGKSLGLLDLQMHLYSKCQRGPCRICSKHAESLKASHLLRYKFITYETGS